MRYHIDMIKKIGLIVTLIIAVMFLPCSANAWKSGKSENGSSNVFIYHIPDEDEGTGDVSTKNTEVETTASDTAQNEGKAGGMRGKACGARRGAEALRPSGNR